MPPRTQPDVAAKPKVYRFTADRGVVMFDQRVRFERDADAPGGARQYTFTTADEDLAARLREVQGYGISEVTS